MEDKKLQKFMDLAKPLMEFLKNFDPHARIIITENNADIVSDVLGFAKKED